MVTDNWTELEDIILRKLYLIKPINKVARELGKSTKEVSKRIKELDISKNTLCDTCVNAYADRCLFMALENPELGLKLMGAKALKVKLRYRSVNKEVYYVYKVWDCKHYVREIY